MTISLHLTAAVLTVVGLIVYMVPAPTKINEFGRIAFFVGLFALVAMGR